MTFHASLFICVSLILAACGGDDSTGSPDGGVRLDGSGGTDGGPRVDGTIPGTDGGPDTDAGSGDDGGPGTDGGGDTDGGPVTDGGPCSTCIAQSLSFGYEGGFVAWTARSRIDACADYTYTRMTFGGTMMSCSNTVPMCGAAGPVTIEQVLTALAHPHVTAAFAAAPILYGRDDRPSDGVVFEIEPVGDPIVTVGSPCMGPPGGCVAIPPGVAALRDLLEQLETERLAEPDCSTIFP